MTNIMRRNRWTFAIILAAAVPWACAESTDIDLLEISGSGVLFGQAFLDLDGSGTFSAGDSLIVDGAVVLTTSGTGDVVDMTTTDTLGAFILLDIPVGSYRLSLDAAVLGDSLDVLGAGDAITVALGDTTLVNLGASFAILSLEEALVAPVGRRIFTSGIALNSRVNFGDGQVHFAGDSAFLRALNMERAGIQPGDSLRILGRVVTDNGRPALDEVTPFVLIRQATLVLPKDTTTGIAATADGGRLDAALIRISDAEISDTSTAVDGNFRFWADDGSDSIEVVLRDFLTINTSLLRPDTIIRIDQITGLLSPFDDGTGTVRWRLLPRGGGDIALETKLADISVTPVSPDTIQASLGDTVEIGFVVENVGLLTATGVRIQNTTPLAFGLVSATVTAGVYDAGTGIWNLGDLAAASTGAVADTLRLRLEVTDGTPALIGHVAQSLGLTFETDSNGGNNGAVVFVIIS